jgi:cation-transporting P-type ATPase 13A2
MSESVPSSTTGFAHRRARADSVTSFTYYPDDESPENSTWPEDEIVEEGIEEVDEDDLDSTDEQSGDVESGLRSSRRRKSSGFSRISVDDPLLARSSRIDSKLWPGDRITQKIYIANEDLTVVFAGFKTSKVGFVIYLILCCVTAGLGYLVLRWVPRWKVRLIGSPCALGSCHWVVIEASKI